MRAAARGDVTTAKVVARDLTDGGDDHEDKARIGGALGYLQLATEPVDLADGIPPAAAGCGSCHASRGVHGPPLPAWAHETGAARAVASLVWNDPTPPPSSEDQVVQALAEAWTVGDAEDRVTEALRVCQRCHAE